MNPSANRVFGYVRVSTENQLENYSIDEQVARLKGYCTAKGWTLLKIYTDGGFSGGSLNRPALTQMLADLRTSKVEAVVVYKLDRLSRSQKDTLTLIEDEFLAHSVDFVSINENFDTSTPFGRAMIGMLSVFAQLEKDQITERFTMGRIGRSKAGYYHGGSTPPTGYDYVDGHLVVNSYEALIIREIYRLFLAGRSINAISRELAPKYAIPCSAAKIRHILKNSVYTGRVKFAGKEYPGIHEPLISEEMYTEVQRLFQSPEREAGKTSAQKTPFRAGYLLSSLIYCAHCGARYSANHGYYRCYSRSKSSRRFIKDPNCQNEHWEISALDHYVVSSIRQLTNDRKHLETFLSECSRLEEKPIDGQKIKARLAEIENQLNQVLHLYQIGSIPMEMIAERAQKLDAEKRRLVQELAAVPAAKEEAERFLIASDAFAEGYDRADTDARRMYINSLIAAIYVDGRTVHIQWRI